LWANDIDNPNKIMPGDKIFILPVTGVKHVVKSGDNIDKIEKKYEADKQKIIDFNDLTADGAVKEGEELVIPDGQIEQPATPNNLLQRRDYYSSGVADGTSRGPSIIDRNPKGGHRFPWGYCTWYVAQSKYVPWGGNAGTWLYHARAYGAKTGKKPKKGAIIVTSESWYGHVGIVTKVKGSSITIREMNYRGFGVESSRTISTKNRVIKGYIY
jgi:surface antigen